MKLDEVRWVTRIATLTGGLNGNPCCCSLVALGGTGAGCHFMAILATRSRFELVAYVMNSV